MLYFLMTIALAGPMMEEAAFSFGPVPRPVIVVVSASGIGYPPRNMQGVQGRLMARRAAEVTAVRNLAAKLGMPPNTRIHSFRYVSARNLPGGAVEVMVETIANGRATAPPPTIPRQRLRNPGW